MAYPSSGQMFGSSMSIPEHVFRGMDLRELEMRKREFAEFMARQLAQQMTFTEMKNPARQEIQWHMGVDVGASTRTSTGTSYYRDRYEGEPIMSPQYYERIKQKPPPVKKLDWKDSLRKEIKEYLTLN